MRRLLNYFVGRESKVRDNEGTVTFDGDEVVRQIKAEAGALPFLRSTSARSFVQTGRLIPYEFSGPQTLRSPKLPFVSYPFEWCDKQLHLAGKLTLDISREIFADRFELKDASAWNVIFRGNQPVFCDHLSFQPIGEPHWWAFGQFVRHFVMPLVVSRVRGIKPHELYSVHRDGLPPAAARHMLGLRRYVTRYWPLMLDSKAKHPMNIPQEPHAEPLHENLYGFCDSLLEGVKLKRTVSEWSTYVDTRSHYSADASTSKREQVAAWIELVRPSWVVDLGCNAGEFTIIAEKAGANVIAIDLDHDAIQKLVIERSDSTTIHPLVTNLADMIGGRGWCGDEFPSLMLRLNDRADLLLMLALVHHLAISEGIPLERVAEMAARISRRYLIVEYLHEDDPMVRLLCSQRKRSPSEFSVDAQSNAFGQHFNTVASYCIPNTLRTLCLLEKRT